MKRMVMVICVSKRSKEALEVQKILTKNGCIIKTRLGIHEAESDKCSECGIIVIETKASPAENNKLAGDLNKLPGVKIGRAHV